MKKDDRDKDEVQTTRPDTFSQQIKVVFLEALTRADDGTLTRHAGQLVGFAVDHPTLPHEIRILDAQGVRRYKLTPIKEAPPCR